MALTVGNIKQVLGGAGNKNIAICDVDFDSSYPTGGESFAPSLFGWDSFDIVMAMPRLGYVFDYDYSGELLLAYWADNDAGADGALVEVTDQEDISAIVDAKVLVIGA